MSTDLSFDSGVGLGAILKGNRLKVPINQREYKWETVHVTEMLQDIANAMSRSHTAHFMGTIVLTKLSDEEWEIADGQQRLATTTIFFAAVRDLLLERNDEKRARGYEQDFLFTIDPDSSDEVARLTLNADDNDFFLNRILRRREERKSAEPRLTSHDRLKEAYETIRAFLTGLEQMSGKGFSEELLKWRKFLLGGAKVFALKVADSRLAFIMFETLNDRGIEASQVDLVKNHLFQEAGKRDAEAQRAWSAMRGAIESISERSDDLVKEYVRWVACIQFGITREKELFERIAEKSKGPSEAIAMLDSLERLSDDYSAILNPSHSKWSDYPTQVRGAIKTLIELDVKQMRPLVLSAAKNFNRRELCITLDRLISWAVRLTIAGGSKAGRLDVFYAELAHRIHKGELKTYAALYDAAKDTIPNDGEFKVFFQQARVKVGKTARYYLRCLEKAATGLKEPAYVVNEDPGAVTLEHVMPQTYCQELPYTKQDVETHSSRLGNLALLQGSKNVQIDRDDFSKKKPILADCPYVLTSMIADQFNSWGTAEIEQRQARLGDEAIKAWKTEPL